MSHQPESQLRVKTGDTLIEQRMSVWTQAPLRSDLSEAAANTRAIGWSQAVSPIRERTR